MSDILKALRNPRLMVILLMGFSSGLPLLLIGSTLRTWLAEQQIPLSAIGLLAFARLPYVWKFLWSPLMDRYTPPFGRRRGWILITQVGVMGSLLLFSVVDAKTQPTLFALVALSVAFFAASQDISIDAYRREILPDEQMGIGSSLTMLGYRIGLWIAGAGALIFADHIAWTQVYIIMAALMSVGMITTLLAPEPIVEARPPQSLREAVISPLRDFFSRNGAWTILAFVMLYKFGESVASDWYTPFLRLHGYSKTEIAAAAKTLAIWAMILGGTFGGVLMVRLKIYRSLWLFGLLQSIALLLYALVAYMSPHLSLLALATFTEYFTSSMASAAFVTFIAIQSNKSFTATQMALLNSLTMVPSVVFAAMTGWIAEQTGWPIFFILCAVMTIPGLFVLTRLKPLIAD